MSAEPIRYFDRYKQTVETEQIYGEKWLRWAYETAPGRLTVWLAARRAQIARGELVYIAHQMDFLVKPSGV